MPVFEQNRKVGIISDDGNFVLVFVEWSRFGMNGVLHLPAPRLFTTAMDVHTGSAYKDLYVDIWTMACSRRRRSEVRYREEIILSYVKDICIVVWLLCLGPCWCNNSLEVAPFRGAFDFVSIISIIGNVKYVSHHVVLFFFYSYRVSVFKIPFTRIFIHIFNIYY